MSEIVMPRLSDTMEEGTILRWLKADGDTVERGEELVEIETDKATMVYESDVAGKLTLIAAEGDSLPVGAPIARVGEQDDDHEDGSPVADAREAEATSPVAGAALEPAGAAGAGSPGPGAAGARDASDRASAAVEAQGSGAENGARAATGRGPDERIKASPLARRVARERGVDLATVAGSGPDGRIVRADVEAGGAVAAPSPADAEAGAIGREATADGATRGAAARATASDAVATAKGATTEVELSRLQQTVARRMAESKATIPDFSLSVDVDMDECVRLREQLKTMARDGAEASPTYNDMVVKACALSLREHPKANGSYRDGRLLLHTRVNVGVAVAADDALVVPTVFDADSKSLGEIARETRALAERVREQTITPPELGGGTFTVSNLGMFGIRSFTAIINPPQAAIMSVGALERRAVVAENGAVEPRRMLTLTLVCDHRILYGAEAARFLARVGELLQSPAALTL